MEDIDVAIVGAGPYGLSTAAHATGLRSVVFGLPMLTWRRMQPDMQLRAVWVKMTPTAPDGRGTWYLEAVLTPGHAPGHLAFWEPRYRLFFAADLVSTQTSIVIAPPDGAVLIEDGLIRYVGPRDQLQLPAQTPVVTAAAATPGLIDAHTVVPTSGLLNIPADQEQDEQSDPNQADVRLLDSFNPHEPLLQFLCEQGVTVVHAMPGRVNVIAGQSKTMLFGTPYHFLLTPPVIVMGAGRAIPHSEGTKCLVAEFASDVGEVVMQVCLRL